MKSEKKRPYLILVRGLPGSGKSTFAKKNFVKKHGFVHLENDMFLYDKDGNYVWTPEKAKEAIQKCYNETAKALAAGKDVVVTNVFVTFKSTRRYLELAKKYNAEFKIYRKDKDYGNIHNVPEKTLKQFKQAFQDIPGEILVDRKC